MEYFTAEELSHTCGLPSDLAIGLNPHVAKREWDVVCQLAYQLKGRISPSNTNDLFRNLLESASVGPIEEQWNFLLFATRCLGFMVPSPLVRRALGSECLRRCVEWTSANLGNEQLWRVDTPRVSEVVENLLNAASEARGTIGELVKETLVQQIKEGTPDTQEVSADLALNLSYAAVMSAPSVADEVKHFWRQTSRSIADACSQELITISERSLSVCAGMLWEGIRIQQFVDWHGAASLFKERPSAALQTRFGSVAELMLRVATQSIAKGNLKTPACSRVRDIGKALLDTPTPWIHDAGLMRKRYLSWTIDDLPPAGASPDAADADLLFGVLALMGVFIEVDPGFLFDLVGERHPLLKICGSLLAGRDLSSEQHKSRENPSDETHHG